jgi:hypothetical protein
MCGLVGIAGALTGVDDPVMRKLLVLDYFRGPDSTGLAAIRSNKEVKIAKGAVNPLDLFDTGRFKQALNGLQSVAYIGHNRAATRGVVNNNNAHPFEVDHIVGAHNGTLDYSSHRDIEKELGEEFTVDSEAVFAAIAKLGVAEAVRLFRGAWALVYYNSKEHTLNFLRNKERPLFCAYTKDHKRVFWASEWPMIAAAIRQPNGDNYQEMFVNKDNIGYFHFEENQHISFNLDELKKGGDKPKFRSQKLEGREPFLVQGHSSNYGTGGTYDPFNVRHPNNNNVTPITAKKGSTTNSRGISGSVRNGSSLAAIIHLTGTQDDKFAGRISREKFDELTKGGCSFCNSKVDFDNPYGVSIYDKEKMALCKGCSSPDGRNSIRIYTDKMPVEVK